MRIKSSAIEYPAAGADRARAQAVSLRALALVAERLRQQPTAGGTVPRLQIEVRVPRGAGERELSSRIADAVSARLLDAGRK
jgi:hypothetical protein